MLFNSMGFDIIRLPNSPNNTYLGLHELNIRTIIDVGANKGQFAQMISKIFPKAHIYCFEPLSDPFKELSKWAERQNGRVCALNTALGDSEGDMHMFCHLEHSPSSSLLSSTEICEKLYPFTKKQTSIPVKLTTLDKIVANMSIPIHPDMLIKLDVQGYEDRVLRGGTEVLHKARVCILEICLDKLYESQANFKEILLLLYDMGFHYAGNLEQAYADDGHVIYFDAVFLR